MFNLVQTQEFDVDFLTTLRLLCCITQPAIFELICRAPVQCDQKLRMDR